MANVRQALRILPKVSTACVGSTSVTDRQKTGRQMGDIIALVTQDDRGVGRFDRAYTSFYSILPYLPPFGGCSEMLVEDRKFHPTYRFGVPFEFWQDLCLRKLELIGSCPAFFACPTLSRFDRTPTCGEQTDRQTMYWTASATNNGCILLSDDDVTSASRSMRVLASDHIVAQQANRYIVAFHIAISWYRTIRSGLLITGGL